jgi:hypothetical protein
MDTIKHNCTTQCGRDRQTDRQTEAPTPLIAGGRAFLMAIFFAGFILLLLGSLSHSLQPSVAVMSGASGGGIVTGTTSYLQKTISYTAQSRGCHLISGEIIRAVPELSKFSVGMANIFLKHTSGGEFFLGAFLLLFALTHRQ